MMVLCIDSLSFGVACYVAIETKNKIYLMWWLLGLNEIAIIKQLPLYGRTVQLNVVVVSDWTVILSQNSRDLCGAYILEGAYRNNK